MKRQWPRVGSFVIVEWDDAYELLEGSRCPLCKSRRPVNVKEDGDRAIFKTAGWIVRRTTRSVYLAQEQGPDDADPWRGVTRVPLRWVQRIVKIA